MGEEKTKSAADKRAIEHQAALPELKELAKRPIVLAHVDNARAQDAANDHPECEVLDALLGDSLLGGTTHCQPGAHEQRDHQHQAKAVDRYFHPKRGRNFEQDR